MVKVSTCVNAPPPPPPHTYLDTHVYIPYNTHPYGSPCIKLYSQRQCPGACTHRALPWLPPNPLLLRPLTLGSCVLVPCKTTHLPAVQSGQTFPVSCTGALPNQFTLNITATSGGPSPGSTTFTTTVTTMCCGSGTAYARGSSNSSKATCFSCTNWGWYNQFSGSATSYNESFPMYLGAAQVRLWGSAAAAQALGAQS